MGTRRLRSLGLTLILCLFSVTIGLAQSVHDGTITGTVTLSSGERVPGVTIILKSPALISERMVISDAEGRFVFLSVPPGTYNVNATLQGFKTYSARNVVMNAGSSRDLKVEMQPGAYEESIVVTGAAPIVDTKSSTVSTTFSDDMLQKLPTARSAFYDLAITAPGIASVGSEESWLASPSAYGSSASENVFLVNGVNATNPRGAPWGSLVQVNYNTVEEVKILSLGSKAEYGSFSGAAIDVLTKSGGNKMQGDLSYYSLVGNAADNYTLDFGSNLFYADPADELSSIPEKSWEGSFTLGGAIMRDRLWFYGGLARYGAETNTPLFEPLATWKQALYDLKLTGDITSKQRAWLAYHYEDSTAGNNTWGQTWDGTMAYDQGQKNNTLQAQYQWVLNDRNLISAKYLGFKTDQSPTPAAGVGHPGYINWWKWIGTQSIGVNGDFPYVESQKSKRQTLQADATHYAADFLGEHEVKFGVQYTRSEGNWLGGYFQGYANFAYPYPWDYGPAKDWWWNCDADWCWGSDANPVFPMYNMKTYRNPWLTVRQSDSTGLFIDDTWTISPRLTFNLGLRYDRMTAKYGEGAVYEMPTTPDDINNPVKIRTRAGSDNIFDFKTWSPRLGFALTLTDDRKTVLSAHVGRYYSPLGVESLRRFGPDMEPTLTEVWQYNLPMSAVDANHNGMIDPNEVIIATKMLANRAPSSLMRSSTTAASWALDVAPGTTSPYTDQFELSLQRQIGADISVEGTYIYKATKDLISLQPYNTATGKFYDWVSRPFTTWRDYETKAWEIALQDYDGNGKTDIDDARFVVNHVGYRAVNAGEFAPGGEADRKFQGLQFVMTKRLSNRWQGLASVNWSHSTGVAPRTVSQDWYIDGPMIMDTPFGSSLNHFQNNLEGPLPMTPEWMLKASGSYTIPRIETDLGMRWRFDSGRPFWPVQSLPTFATWMSSMDNVFLGTSNDWLVADDPTNPDWTPNMSIFDLSVGKTLQFGKYSTKISLDVLNALNADTANRVGWRQADYGRVYAIVQPRTYRAGVKFMF